MSTTPPEHPPEHSYADLRHTGVSGAILPVPGNAEIAIWFIVEIVLAIVALASSRFDAHDWGVATTWITAAYLISRGIAKASRVLEH